MWLQEIVLNLKRKMTSWLAETTTKLTQIFSNSHKQSDYKASTASHNYEYIMGNGNTKNIQPITTHHGIKGKTWYPWWQVTKSQLSESKVVYYCTVRTHHSIKGKTWYPWWQVTKSQWSENKVVYYCTVRYLCGVI